ncbi:MAG: T9SS type A sorting domain-containing protein, partial [Bacteroidales bacterium]
PLPEWSEPGMVYVMKDENHNDRPDDTWYVLAGSDYFFSSTESEHSIIYYQPEEVEDDISWENSSGQSGSLVHNSFHQQSYYPGTDFEAGFYQDNCQFELVRISGSLDPFAPGAVKSYTRAFGLADNLPSLDWNADMPDNPYTWEQEGYGGDPFDLSWAVDEAGEYADLDTVHFVKVQTSMYGMNQTVGEISTEITSGRLSTPNPGLSAENRMIVLEDVSVFSEAGDHQLRAYYFENGRYIPDTEINWEMIEGNEKISPSGIIHLSPGLNVTIKAKLRNGEISSRELEIKIPETNSSLPDNEVISEGISIWPNPASNNLNLELNFDYRVEFNLQIRDMGGRLILMERITESQTQLDVSDLNPGVYMLLLSGKKSSVFKKFVKR